MAVALITGGSSGLGIDFAVVMAQRGYDLVLVARSGPALASVGEKIARDFPVKVTTIAADLSTVDSAKRLFAECKRRQLEVDVLINNAGCGNYGPLIQSNLKDLTGMIQLNAVTLTELCWLFGGPMLKRRYGHILNVASTAAFAPGPFMAGYYATKAYVQSLSEALHFEFRGTGVHVSALCPGPTATDFFRRANVKITPLKQWLLADSRRCAERGVRGLLAGQSVIIDGFVNWCLVFGIRLLPRSIVRQVSAALLLSSK